MASIRNILAPTPSELKTEEDVSQRIAKHKLVLILFNELYPEAEDIEHKFNVWRKIYEDKYNLYVYKCVISVGEHPLKTKYHIENTPTFIFFRNGKLHARLDDAGEIHSNTVPSSNNNTTDNPNEESLPKDVEQQLRRWLDKCLK